MMYIYIAQRNSDRTEGRGPMVDIGWYSTEEGAYEAVKGLGVMGVGDGEITRVILDNPPSGLREKIYGYHLSRVGWRSGWVDERDLHIDDKEFAQYLRLKEKYS